ncbi:MAG: glycoside hydrolase family 127 protein [Fimbriimonas sp.]|nr:glycoside hydrolase family 127 protein [Fimbriimonas sp.]
MLSFSVALAVVCATTATVGLAKGKRVIEPFDYRGVRLTGGRLGHEVDEVRDYYLNLPLDDLLHGFRVRAGLPAPGKELGGWYTGDNGNVFPQILSGIARMYASTGDARCLEKAHAMLTEWTKCIGPDGYPMYTNHPTSRQYFYEKVAGAMVDMARYCKRKDALDALSRVTDWAVKSFTRDRVYANANGDRNNPLCDSGEWYTVSENLYRAYLETGDEKYRDFAKVWEYTDYWDTFAHNGDIFVPRANGERTEAYHAYSHVNTFASDAAAYLVTGEPHYLDALKNAYDFLQATQVFATGGYGPDEQLAPHARILQLLKATNNTFETQCGSWAAFKMSKYLMSFTGDAKYGDWVERLTLNGIGASLPMSSSGQVTYYSNYRPGPVTKELFGDGWSCCTGTRPQAVADYADQVFFRDDRSLYVNLFTPSTATHTVAGQAFTVTQQTRFPEVSTTSFTFSLSHPVRFALKLRSPGWLAAPITATLNGASVKVATDDLQWAVIDRHWKDGDRLEVNLPAKLWTCRFGNDAKAPGAIMFGPVVLAFRSLDGDPTAKLNLDDPAKCLVPVAGEPLSFHVKDDANILARPFYAFQQGEPYYMYFGL